MPILFQTARLPVVYKARFWSFATIFHFICTLVKYAAPILASYFYIISRPGNTFDLEFPSVVPGEILFFNVLNTNGTSIAYPQSVIPGSSNATLLLMTQPHYDSKDRLDSWKIDIRIPNKDIYLPETVSISLLFNFTVNLRKYALNTIQALGSFSRTFKPGVQKIICQGDLVLEQTEFIEFRGSFNESDLTNFSLSDYDSFADLMEARDEKSALFYVGWDSPFFTYDTNHAFELELNIRVKDITIFHSIPLVSSIEMVLIIFLSTFLLASLILDTLQGFIFRHGIIKNWAIPLYQKTKKMKSII